MVKFIKNLLNNERKDVKMSKVLYITANPKSKDESYSLTVGDAFIKAYKKAHSSEVESYVKKNRK